MIWVILVYGRFPQSALMIPTLLGLHLHSMGVKRRTINFAQRARSCNTLFNHHDTNKEDSKHMERCSQLTSYTR
jgi:hypothetical protein